MSDNPCTCPDCLESRALTAEREVARLRELLANLVRMAHDCELDILTPVVEARAYLQGGVNIAPPHADEEEG